VSQTVEEAEGSHGQAPTTPLRIRTSLMRRWLFLMMAKVSRP
jgi:hypothetical protein